MKKIIVISEGNPFDPKTWSNIPFFLIKGLIDKGYEVYGINVGANKYVQYFFNHIICFFIKIFDGNDSEYKFNRTFLYDRFCKYKIKKEIKKIGNYDIAISTSYSFSPEKNNNIKRILLCDWTLDYHIQNFKMREATFLEKKAIKRQDNLLKDVDLIISLFPNIANIMAKKYYNVKYIGNVINIEKKDIKVDLEKKYESNKILFIGGIRYLEGAIELIRAVDFLNKEKNMNLELNIIGLESNNFNFEIPNSIKCHGYLNKASEKENNLYYQLINESKICFNTTPIWAGFSSLVEVMELSTPVVVSKFDSFVNTFGTNFNEYYYCENSSAYIAEKIEYILNLKKNDYFSLCIKMNSLVSGMTWEQFIDNLIKEF